MEKLKSLRMYFSKSEWDHLCSTYHGRVEKPLVNEIHPAMRIVIFSDEDYNRFTDQEKIHITNNAKI